MLSQGDCRMLLFALSHYMLSLSETEGQCIVGILHSYVTSRCKNLMHYVQIYCVWNWGLSQVLRFIHSAICHQYVQCTDTYECEDLAESSVSYTIHVHIQKAYKIVWLGIKTTLRPQFYYTKGTSQTLGRAAGQPSWPRLALSTMHSVLDRR